MSKSNLREPRRRWWKTKSEDQKRKKDEKRAFVFYFTWTRGVDESLELYFFLHFDIDNALPLRNGTPNSIFIACVVSFSCQPRNCN